MDDVKYIEYALNINFSDQNCLTRYNSERIGPDGQNIIGHTDVLINDKYFLWTRIHVRFKTINKDNSYFYKNTRLSFNVDPVSP